jgi:hypothetical protein
MKIDDISSIVAGFAGVRRSTRVGLVQWRFRGRLVARQLDASHVVIRAQVEVRGALITRQPDTFCVPARLASHQMVVADLSGGCRSHRGRDRGGVGAAATARHLSVRRPLLHGQGNGVAAL